MSQPRRQLPWWKKLCFAALIVLGLPLVLEAGARLLHGWNRHWLDCHRPHPTLGWVLREGWAGKWSWTGGYARINGQGLRMDEELAPKGAGTRRLLCLGDSVTFGANVKTSETFPSQLQQRLQARGLSWQVLNGGVTSYDPAQEQEWLEAFGWRLEPDALLVTFCRNDVYPSRRQVSDAHRSAGKAGQWLSEHSLIFFKLERLAARVRAGWGGSSGQQMVVDQTAPLTGFPFVEQAYRRLAASAQARGVPVSLALMPTFETLTGAKPDGLTAQLTALGVELGWRVIDLTPALLPAEAALFLPHDPIHPSAAGYTRIAAYLASRLVD
jgi:lysophospholipase L1-like esterase